MKKPKRIILGIGYPWFKISHFGRDHLVKLIDKNDEGIRFRKDWDEDALCDGNLYRLVFERIKKEGK